MVSVQRASRGVTSQPVIFRDLLGLQNRPCFQVRRQMNRAQSTLDFANRCHFGGQPLGRDFSLRKKLVEQTFAVDQFGAERSGGSAHSIMNRGHLTGLRVGQAKLPRKTRRLPTRSSSRLPWKATRERWAIAINGRPNGSGTASVVNSFAVTVSPSSGHAEKTW